MVSRIRASDTCLEFGTGRIAEIIEYLKSKYTVNFVRELSTRQKLDTLCEFLQLSHQQFDRLIVSYPPVLRTIKGHVFENVFVHLVSDNGYEVVEVGGDNGIDLIVNGNTLQLKSPYVAGSKGSVVQYKTHKTHGAKSEDESLEYYHSASDFADYLVGLVSYSPMRVIFLQRTELPRHPRARNKILSPFEVRWDNHPGLNAFDRIGIDRIDLSTSRYLCSDPVSELLPRSAQKLNVKTGIILNTILKKVNFRIWDMSIRGFAREVYFQDYLREHRIAVYNPTSCRAQRGDKADLALCRKSDGKLHFLQVKGVSLNNCQFTGKSSTVAVETQLTRGRVNDHPTQSRLYLTTDFGVLLIGIDPSLVQKYREEVGFDRRFTWEFYALPVSNLATHLRFTRRLKSMQKFKYLELQAYLVSEPWIDTWQQALGI